MTESLNVVFTSGHQNQYGLVEEVYFLLNNVEWGKWWFLFVSQKYEEILDP